jgi:4-hydroxybenzoate polyprenyltransferase
MIEFYIENLGTISISFGLFSAVIQAVFYVYKKRKPELAGIILKTLAGAGIPTGMALIFCAFKISWVNLINNPEVYVLISGICILYISLISIFPQLNPDKPPPAGPTDPNNPALKS